MKLLALILVTFGLSSAQALEGTLELSMVGDFVKGMRLEAQDNKLLGNIYGFGRHGGVQKVDLEVAADGRAKGRMGMQYLNTTEVVKKSETQTDLQIQTTTGSNSFFVEAKNEGLVVRAFPDRAQGRLSNDGTRIHMSNDDIALELKEVSKGVYKGTAIQWTGTMSRHAYVTLKTTEELNPRIAKDNHALYTLLYVLPMTLK